MVRQFPEGQLPLSCAECLNGAGLDFEFTMAFQPILDFETRTIYAHEALVRGLNSESAATILSRVTDINRYRFDQACRVKALQWAAKLKIETYLRINFLPNAVYDPATCLRATLEAAQELGFPTNRVIFEITEGERVADQSHLSRIVKEYKRHGFKTAIDDFGAGYAGLNFLAEYLPDIIKLDMQLTRKIHTDRTRRAIVLGILGVCRELNLDVIAEGIEELAEFQVLRAAGVRYFQGYYFASPVHEGLASIPVTIFDS